MLGLVKPHDYIRPGKEREGCQPEGEDGEGEKEVQRAELRAVPFPATFPSPRHFVQPHSPALYTLQR